MVNIGFIVEGGSEKIIIESQAFNSFLLENNYTLIQPVIDAQGGGNLLPDNIEVMIQTLKKNHAEKICVLTDLEEETSSQVVKDRLANDEVDEIFVAVKALEAWFLADTEAMRRWLKSDDFIELNPEDTTQMPWLRLKEVAKNNNANGPGSKIAFAKKIVRFDFSITNAAAHDNCPSATELVTTLET